MRRLSTVGIVAGAVVLGSVLSPVASAGAASAKSVILGHANKTTATTGIKNTKGTPLALIAGKGKAPMTVNSTKTVTNLSADRLDGNSSGAFAYAKVQTGTIWGSVNDADGYINTARCPKGTVSTGGGGFVLDSSGVDAINVSVPDFDDTGKLIPNSWFTTSVERYAVAFVTCYNPHGKVPGASSRLPSDSSIGQGVAARAAGASAAAVAKANHQKVASLR